MSRESSAKEWLHKAESDRDTAKYLLAGGKYDDCAFYCQQAVEKLLKATIVLQTGKRPPHTHDLLGLAEHISGIEIGEAEQQSISSVNAYYAGSRYPLDTVDPSAFNEATAQSAIEKVDSIFVWFLTRNNFDNE